MDKLKAAQIFVDVEMPRILGMSESRLNKLADKWQGNSDTTMGMMSADLVAEFERMVAGFTAAVVDFADVKLTDL